MVREVWPSSFLISTTVPCSGVTHRVLSGKLTTAWEVKNIHPFKHLPVSVCRTLKSEELQVEDSASVLPEVLFGATRSLILLENLENDQASQTITLGQQLSVVIMEKMMLVP